MGIIVKFKGVDFTAPVVEKVDVIFTESVDENGLKLLSMAAAEDGYNVYYTLDGSTPDQNSPVYSSPILIGFDTTVKAVAYNPITQDSGNVCTHNVVTGVVVYFDGTLTLNGTEDSSGVESNLIEATGSIPVGALYYSEYQISGEGKTSGQPFTYGLVRIDNGFKYLKGLNIQEGSGVAKSRQNNTSLSSCNKVRFYDNGNTGKAATLKVKIGILFPSSD